MKRITITIGPQVYDKLPKRDRSAFINLLLKQHFQADNAERLYQAIKQQLLKDHEFQSWVRSTAGEILNPDF